MTRHRHRHRHRHRLAALLLVVAAVATVAACGVSSDRLPRDVNPDDVPFDLLAPSNTTPPTTEPGPTSRLIDVYLVGTDRLAPSPREVAVPVRAGDRVDALLAGVTDAEATAGLRTAIPAGTLLLDTELADGVLTLDLSEDLLTVQGAEQKIAMAQLVFTSTSADGVEAVLFEIEGEPVQVPVDDGSLSAEPLTRRSYPSLAPRS
ncbi:MAG: GerMN domain-containing protein [Acidimicrobiales bacterium]|nr:GerMN domain-containing protein [Acidimicrobiales bacterium]